MQLSAPFYDEYSHGHLGRIRMLNNIDSNMKTILALKAIIKNTYQPRAYFIIEFLANAGNKTLVSYLKEHTLFSVTSDIEIKLATMQYSPVRIGYIRTLGIEQSVTSGVFCPECINEDLSEMGFSYWRRQHQIIGATHCTIHRAQLYLVKDSSVFDKSPSSWIDQGENINDNIPSL